MMEEDFSRAGKTEDYTHVFKRIRNKLGLKPSEMTIEITYSGKPEELATLTITPVNTIAARNAVKLITRALEMNGLENHSQGAAYAHDAPFDELQQKAPVALHMALNLLNRFGPALPTEKQP